MPLIQIDFKSETLRLACTVNVVIGQRIAAHFDESHRSPILYLLHGLSGDHSYWLRRTSIERYADEYDVAVVMPAVHRSFYLNTHSGQRYHDYLTEELPRVCRRLLPVRTDRENSFIAGLSMGGYGAFHAALSLPNNYAAAASLSGALDIRSHEAERNEMFPEWQSVFGPDLDKVADQIDLLKIASKQVATGQPLPKLYQCCGTEDYLYRANQNFLRHAREIGLPVHYEEGPGQHEWGYWDAQIQKVLEWLPLKHLEDPQLR